MSMKGTIRYAGYNQPGQKPKKKGLRNKRKAHKARLKREAEVKARNIEMERKRREYGGDGFQDFSEFGF